MSDEKERENEAEVPENGAAPEEPAATEGAVAPDNEERVDDQPEVVEEVAQEEAAAAEGAVAPEAEERGGDQPGVVEEAVQEEVAAVGQPGRVRFLLTAAVSGGVLIFALAFFMAGFAAHAMLDDGSSGSGGGGSGGGAADSAAMQDDPFWGPEDASVVIEEFSDFQCPYCKRFVDDTLPKLREAYGDKVRFIYRDLPLSSIHPVATVAAEAAGCASDQGLFWEYHDILFLNQQSLSESTLVDYARQAGLDMTQFNDCFTSGKKTIEVMIDSQDAKKAGATGTPAFLINDLLISGAQPFEVFKSVIDSLLASQ